MKLYEDLSIQEKEYQKKLWIECDRIMCNIEFENPELWYNARFEYQAENRARLKI